MKLKEIVFIVIVFFVFKGFDDLLSKHNYDFNCLFDPKTYTEDGIPMEESDNTINDTVYIKGLGDFDQSSLVTVKQTLEEVYDVNCVIGEPCQTKESYYNQPNSLGSREVYSDLGGHVKVVYVTNENLHSDETGKNLKGVTSPNNKTMVVRTKTLKRTTIHEFGHSLGLDHCENEECVMNTSKDVNTSTEFCVKCKNQLKR